MNDASAADGEIFFSARGIGRHFRMGGTRIEVLHGVDLDVARGDFVAIKGSSGTGKSTLLHILGLLDRPSEGSLTFEGKELARASESVRTALRATEFSFVFQFYYLLPEFNTVENVFMPALIAGDGVRSLRGRNGRKERRARATELLERVGLGHRLKHRPSRLSGGERQRVAIARALMNQPRIVFCDEPTGNLDTRTAEEIHALLGELNETLEQTIVVVTHERAMAEAARRSLEMIDGVIVNGRLDEPAGDLETGAAGDGR